MPKTIFILGSGPRIGRSVAKKFKSSGYAVAIGSRHPDEAQAREDGFLPVTVDVMDSSSIHSAFSTVRQELGTPNVVVYNAAALTFPADASNPLYLAPGAFERDTAVNLFGAYAAMGEAVRGFESLVDEEAVPKVFIATGNVLPFQPSGSGISLGAGKAGLVYLIEAAVKAYGARGYRFYFASQVAGDGGPVKYPDVGGETHGRVYYDLVEAAKNEQAEWNVRFLGNGELVGS